MILLEYRPATGTSDAESSPAVLLERSLLQEARRGSMFDRGSGCTS